MPRVVSLAYTPAGVERKPADRYARVSADAVELVPGYGVAGDLKGGSRKRQLNVLFAEAVAELRSEGYKAGPGELGEQVVIAGLNPAAAAPGTRLRLGLAVVEVTERRNGCARFEHIQGRPKEASAGRIGVMAKVVAGGAVRVGDAVEVVESPGRPGAGGQ